MRCKKQEVEETSLSSTYIVKFDLVIRIQSLLYLFTSRRLMFRKLAELIGFVPSVYCSEYARRRLRWRGGCAARLKVHTSTSCTTDRNRMMSGFGMVSGFGMECWGLKVWGSLERWVRVRVTGGDGSPRTNLIQMDLRTDGLLGPLWQLPHLPWLSPSRVSRWLSFHYGFSCLRRLKTRS